MRIAALAAVGAVGLMAGCSALDGRLDGLGGDRAAGAEGPEAAAQVTAEGDILAPEVFAFAGEALWDGRPSLGGVWVAHPDVEAPGRVLIRDDASGAEVTGALFRREDAGAGPPMQVSSDAAAELGLTASRPAALSVTALRRPEPPVPEMPVEEGDPAAPVEPAGAPDAEPERDLPGEAVPLAAVEGPARPASRRRDAAIRGGLL